MNRDLEEQKIRQLFRELRQEDERRAPSFAGVLKPASAKTGVVTYALKSWRFAIATSLLVLALIPVIFISYRSTLLQPGKDLLAADEFIRTLPNPKLFIRVTSDKPSPHVPISNTLPKRLPKPFYRKPVSEMPEQIAIAISHWQSPTEFLLKIPGEEFLRRLPQIGDSLLEIKIDIPDDDMKK